MLDFRDRTRTGVFSVVWPKTLIAALFVNLRWKYFTNNLSVLIKCGNIFLTYLFSQVKCTKASRQYHVFTSSASLNFIGNSLKLSKQYLLNVYLKIYIILFLSHFQLEKSHSMDTKLLMLIYFWSTSVYQLFSKVKSSYQNDPLYKFGSISDNWRHHGLKVLFIPFIYYILHRKVCTGDYSNFGNQK